MAEQIQISLRSIRQQAGLSLSKAAELTGVSKAMLGQIERGESSPTIATLWKLARGFHLPLSAFLTEPCPPSHHAQLRFPDSITVETVFAFDATLRCETFIVTLNPGQAHTSQAHDGGVVEDVFAATGQIEVLFDDQWHPLEPGQGLRFRADQPHGYRNMSDRPARFHNTLHYPSPI